MEEVKGFYRNQEKKSFQRPSRYFPLTPIYSTVATESESSSTSCQKAAFAAVCLSESPPFRSIYLLLSPGGVLVPTRSLPLTPPSSPQHMGFTFGFAGPVFLM